MERGGADRHRPRIIRHKRSHCSAHVPIKQVTMAVGVAGADEFEKGGLHNRFLLFLNTP